MAWQRIAGCLAASAALVVGCAEVESPPETGACPPVCAPDTPIEDPAELIAIAGGSEFFVEVLDVDVVKEKGYAWVATNVQGIQLVDLADPSAPEFWVRHTEFAPLEGTSFIGFQASHVQHVADVEASAIGGAEDRFYVAGAHHGDEPAPNGYVVILEVEVPEVASLEAPATQLPIWSWYHAPNVWFERLEVVGDLLFAAAKDAGVMVFRIVPGDLELLGTLPGFTNAWSVAISGDVAVVADAGGSVHLVDVSQPETMVRWSQLEVPGVPREVVFLEDGVHIAVAAGSAGVHLINVADVSSPVLISTVPVYGTAMDLAATGTRIDVATWEAIAIYDVSDLLHPILLATESGVTDKAFSRFLAVGAFKEWTLGGEWHSLQVFRLVPGAVAPEFHLSDHELDLGTGGDGFAVGGVVVTNQGHLPLEVECSGDGDASCGLGSFELAPGAMALVEVTQQAVEGPTEGTITFATNDPDEGVVQLAVRAGFAGLGPGDDFPVSSFVSPETGQVLLAPDMFSGHVTLLSYYATF